MRTFDDFKFRMWDTVKKEMLDFGLLYGMAGQMSESQIGRNDSFIPLQFTGLKDKNGVEIYEGDVVKWETYRIQIEEVKYISAWFHPFDNSDFSFMEEYCEVIGNIYENPDLLPKLT